MVGVADPKVIYIAGYGRSGSTLLDAILGSLPGVVGTGELTRLFTGLDGAEVCSCSRPVDQCPFWAKVQSDIGGGSGQANHRVTNRLTRRMDARAWMHSARAYIRYRDLWLAVLRSIARASSAELIVDSSKTGRKVSGRITMLSQVCGLDISVVHLVRDPRAVMWSAQRGSNRALARGASPRCPSVLMIRALLGWTLTNIRTEALLYRATEQTPHVRIRYEDLVASPHEVARHALSLGDGRRAPRGDAEILLGPIAPGHGIAGNRMRRRGGQSLRLDDEWRKELPRWAEVLAWSTWPLSRRYGYSLRLRTGGRPAFSRAQAGVDR
jgi:hypothetical protein